MEGGGKMVTEEVTGQKEFARIIREFMKSGKSSARMAKRRGGIKPWKFSELEDLSGVNESTIKKWLTRGNQPEWDNLNAILPLFFDPEIIEGQKFDKEYKYIVDLYGYWKAVIPHKIFENNSDQPDHPLSGRYILLRHTFDAPENFALFDVSFVFSHKAGRLEFRQTELKDQDSTAFVTQPELSPHIEIVETRQDGFNSLTICSVPDEDGYIYGAIFTMAQFSKNAHLPAIAPVVLFPFDETAKLGIVKPDDNRYDRYAELIARSRDPIVFKLHNLASY